MPWMKVVATRKRRPDHWSALISIVTPPHNRDERAQFFGFAPGRYGLTSASGSDMTTIMFERTSQCGRV